MTVPERMGGRATAPVWPGGGREQLMNEFASVHVEVRRDGNGPCLRISDPSSGHLIDLDPLELQALAWSRHEQLAELLAPAFRERRLERDAARDEED